MSDQHVDFDPNGPTLYSQGPNTVIRDVKCTMDMDIVKYAEQVFGRMKADQDACHEMTEAWMKLKQVPREKMCPLGGPTHKLAYRKLYSQFWRNEPGEKQVQYVMCPTCRDKSQGDVNGPLFAKGVPTQLLDATFENWKIRGPGDDGILQVCRSFAGNPIGILILSGPVGLGKSHLAVAILRTMNKFLTLMVTQTRLLRMLRDTYKNKNAVNPVTLCARMKDLLILDELGLTSGGKDEYGEIYDIVGHCYDYRSPLVITTNVPSSQFQNAFGDRIADRLATGKILTLTGTSWR